ncbi:MAG: ABC transporter permease [Bacteroidota bacterium]|nr:ABC transporter permease [Candidatus Kapabacteria bacterium]MDW8220970.1 ABC transporter permease [Bacteroidota bacterium]
MSFHKLLAVARWEFLEKARTKAFIISLLATPMLTLAFVLLPSLLALQGDDTTKKFAFYDETMSLREPVQALLNQKYRLSNGQPNFDLVPIDPRTTSRESFLQAYSPRVFNGDFTGLCIIPANVQEKRTIEYRSDNVGNVRDIRALESAVEKALAQQAALRYGIDTTVLRRLLEPIETMSLKITPSGDTNESGFLQVFGIAYASVLILFILIVGTGQLLVRGLVEEKSNRIMEILLSSCSPVELMLGKLLGLSGLGIVQALSWIAFGLGVALYFNVSLSSPGNIALMVLFMLFGYLLYASLLLGLGSLTTTDQEAQQVTSYVSFLLLIPFVLITVIMQNPSSALAKIFSFIPFTAPTVMVMRISIQMPTTPEIIGSLALLLLSAVLITYFAARIFRVAVLVYGKRPTLPEILAFLKEQ